MSLRNKTKRVARSHKYYNFRFTAREAGATQHDIDYAAKMLLINPIQACCVVAVSAGRNPVDFVINQYCQVLPVVHVHTCTDCFNEIGRGTAGQCETNEDHDFEMCNVCANDKH